MMCTNVYVPGFIVNYIHVFCMETTINLLTSSSDQCLAIAFQNKEKMALLFFIKNVQFTERKGHAAEEQKQISTYST